MASRKRAQPSKPAARQVAKPQAKTPIGISERQKAFDLSNAAIVQPSVRAYRLWTPALLRQAEQASELGNLRYAVWLIEWLLSDDKIRGALDGRVTSFLGLPLTFEASGDGRRRGKAVRALEVDQDWDACFPLEAAKQTIAWGIMLGIGTGVNRWHVSPDNGNRDIPRLEFFHPQPISYSWSEHTWLRQLENGTSEPIVFGDGTWVGHMPFGAFRPWSLGLWRALGRWALLKSYAISDWGRFGETASRNVITSDKAVEDTFERRQELAGDISQLARDGTLVLPPGYKYELVQSTANTGAIFQAQIEMADMAIAVCIRGGNLSTSAKGGASLALGEVQERQGDLLNRREDASAWSSTTHNHSLVPWAQANFGDSKLAPYAAYETDLAEDMQQKATVFTTVMTGVQQAENLGFTVDRQLVADSFGLEFLKPGVVIAPATPAAPPAIPDEQPKVDGPP